MAIVDDKVYGKLKADLNPEIQLENSLFIGVDLKNDSDTKTANLLFKEMEFSGRADSQLEMCTNQKMNIGLVMFIVGFRGLTFHVTSGDAPHISNKWTSHRETCCAEFQNGLQFWNSAGGRSTSQLLAVKSGWFFFGSDCSCR
ncbi:MULTISPECIES: hypothetical protein [Cytobacillus]|uniref:hypothetical protein n=1 Tax=Cytobacillus TaxID=2675230 RepID=UPI00203EB13B|nr:hypothetical protein [Cytobacillus firmus]MCM3708019.1 hypothetical protein [Cytobacillus firmus]